MNKRVNKIKNISDSEMLFTFFPLSSIIQQNCCNGHLTGLKSNLQILYYSYDVSNWQWLINSFHILHTITLAFNIIKIILYEETLNFDFEMDIKKLFGSTDLYEILELDRTATIHQSKYYNVFQVKHSVELQILDILNF